MCNLEIERSAIRGKSRRADITFHESGRIDITSRVAKQIGLESGDVVDVVTSNGEWYFYVLLKRRELMGRHEAQCFPAKNGYNSFRAYSKNITKMILSRTGGDKASVATGELLEFDNIGRCLVIIPHSL